MAHARPWEAANSGEGVNKSVTITVHPASLAGEYLSVSDAMLQVLDFVSALGAIEDSVSTERQIVWRLTEAHTNSPPFTITTEAYPADPVISIALQANRVTAQFRSVFTELVAGNASVPIETAVSAPLKRFLNRNLNGVGRTEIIVDDDVLSVVPTVAKKAIKTIEQIELDQQSEIIDQRHTEYGSVELIVYGLTQWNHKRALLVTERLTGQKLTCVLDDEIADELGGSHVWSEAWQDRRIIATGALLYGKDGSLKRVDAEAARDLPYASIDLNELQEIDLLQGRSVNEHIRLLREGQG